MLVAWEPCGGGGGGSGGWKCARAALTPPAYHSTSPSHIIIIIKTRRAPPLSPPPKKQTNRDVQGIHPLSYAGSGASFKDAVVSKMITQANEAMTAKGGP